MKNINQKLNKKYLNFLVACLCTTIFFNDSPSWGMDQGEKERSRSPSPNRKHDSQSLKRKSESSDSDSESKSPVKKQCTGMNAVEKTSQNQSMVWAVFAAGANIVAAPIKKLAATLISSDNSQKDLVDIGTPIDNPIKIARTAPHTANSDQIQTETMEEDTTQENRFILLADSDNKGNTLTPSSIKRFEGSVLSLEDAEITTSYIKQVLQEDRYTDLTSIEIRSNTLHFNENFTSPGTTLKFETKLLKIKGDTTIDLTGKPGADGNDDNGTNNSTPGSAGGNAGSFFGKASSAYGLKNLTIKLDGGRGGRGGNGTPGKDGKDGIDAFLATPPLTYVSEESSSAEKLCPLVGDIELLPWIKIRTIEEMKECDKPGTDGEEGKNGGDAALGGRGGNGGRGLIQINGQQPLTIIGKPGKKGANGKPGKGGLGGKHGRNIHATWLTKKEAHSLKLTAPWNEPLIGIHYAPEGDARITEEYWEKAPAYMERVPERADSGRSGIVKGELAQPLDEPMAIDQDVIIEDASQQPNPAMAIQQ